MTSSNSVSTKSLFDISLQAKGNKKNDNDNDDDDDDDIDWNQVRIPFFRGNEYIDTKLAFTVELEGVLYGIAIPFDDAVAIIQQTQQGDSILYLHPDGDYEKDDDIENNNYGSDSESKWTINRLELMEFMAAQVQQHLGEELQLRKTPKVLTIRGGLSNYTQNWQTELLPPPIPTFELMSKVLTKNNPKQDGRDMTTSREATEGDDDDDDDDDDEEIASFYEFMKQELGEEEFQKTMETSPEDDEDFDEELLELFSVPGLNWKDPNGPQCDNWNEEMEQLLSTFQSEEEEERQITQQIKTLEQHNLDGVALKLLGFTFADGSDKSYFLVKLLQPFALVGKYIQEESWLENDSAEAREKADIRDVRFELLTSQEEKIVIPKLEELCKKDLEAAGLSLLFQPSKSASSP